MCLINLSRVVYSDDTILVDEEKEGEVDRNGNNHPVDSGEARLPWPPVFIIHDCNIRNNVMKRLKEKLTLNERERSSLLGSIYEGCIKST